MMQVQRRSPLCAVVALLLSVHSTPAASDLVYVASDWPPINLPVLTGSGAPVAAANPAFTAEVAFTPSSGLPDVCKQADNPQTGGACPQSGSFGQDGSCWWTCGFGADGYPCAGPNDKKICKPGKWGLSYDDGPTAATAILLDALKSNNLKATFCLVGSNVVRYPNIVKRIYAEGHDLCVHTWSHSALTTLTNDEIIAEVAWTAKAIQAATGVKPLYFRPPYGDIDNRVRAIVAKMGYKVLLWYFDNSDYLSFPPNPTIDRATVDNNMKTGIANAKNFPNGVIALSHPERGASQGVSIAVEFFNLAKAANIALVPVSVCLGDAVAIQAPTPTTAATPFPTTTSPTPVASVAVTAPPVSAGAAGLRVGSYLLAAVLAMALTGVMRTAWSGYKVGKQD